jgi:hypothetical protein
MDDDREGAAVQPLVPRQDTRPPSTENEFWELDTEFEESIDLRDYIDVVLRRSYGKLDVEVT